MIEMLEARMLLAGGVSASVNDGTLTIEGDRFGNRITIEGLAHGELRLVGDNTSINGEFGPAEFSGATSGILVFLGDGKNSLIVSGVQSEGDFEVVGGSA